jgi:hypothetical protein
MTNNARTPAAERMRLYRERRRRGLRCLVIELRETELDALICRGLLEQETRNDRNAVLKALYGFILAERWDRRRDAKQVIDCLNDQRLAKYCSQNM